MNSERREPESSVIHRGGSDLLGGIERRRNPRYEFSVPVFLRVLVEEETFNPMRFPGRSCNISAGGMSIEIENLSEDRYKTLIRGQRPVRVHVQASEAGGEAVFFGRILWYDYRRNSRGTSCQIGLAFEQMPEKEREILAKILQRLETAAAERDPS